MLIEPGNFRTSFAGTGALLFAEPNPAYEETVGAVREALPKSDGQQAGDPAKAAAAILEVLDAADPPLRLVLGGDAVDAVTGALERNLAEVRTWEAVSRSTAVRE